MKAQELRIGNYVKYCGDIVAVTALGEGGLRAEYKTRKVRCIYNAVHLSEIPLTEEILLKAGFEMHGYTTFLQHTYQRFVLGRNSVYSIDNKTYIYEVNDHDLCELNYVHQLQNLYFALTGEELEIKYN